MEGRQDMARRLQERARLVAERNNRLETLAKEGKWDEILNEYRTTTDEGIRSKMIKLSIQNGRKDILEEFIKIGVDDSLGSTLLHTAAEYDQPEIVTYLLEKGADINAKTYTGYTPLMTAVLSDNISVVEVLMRKNPDVAAKDSIESTVFHQIARSNSGNDPKDILNLLLQNNPPIEVLNMQDNVGNTPLITAAKYEAFYTMNLFLDKGADPKLRNKNGDTALSVVVQLPLDENGVFAVEKLIEKGSNINDISQDGYTPLMLAINEQLYQTASFLVENGADVTIVTPRDKDNALMYLMSMDPKEMEDREGLQDDHYDLMKLLIDNGTDLSAKNINDETAYDIASQAGYSDDILELLNPEKSQGVSDGPIWAGFVKSDIDLFHSLFDRPSDVSLCPICLEYADRTDGCMYMYHKCRTPRHEKLFQKFQVDGNIEWCTLCGRICNGEHHHYTLSLPTDKDLPSLATVRPTSTGELRFFDKDCKASGGGGHEEKIKRFNRMHQYACELQNEVGKITRQDAIQELVEEMWIAASTRNRAVPSMIEKKKFDFPCVFPEGAEVTTRPGEEQPYPDVPRPADEKDLVPIRHEKPDNECVVEIGAHEDDRPVFQFQHKQPDGSIYKHEGEYICGEDLEGLIRGKDIDGKCPINPEKCKGLLYPEELKGVVSDDFYTSYRNNFNRANAVKKGGSAEGLFRRAENAVCAIEKKKAGRRKTYRKNKNKKQKRRRTYRR